MSHCVIRLDLQNVAVLDDRFLVFPFFDVFLSLRHEVDDLLLVALASGQQKNRSNQEDR